MRPSRSSTTWSDHGSWPPPGAGLYCPYAGEPLARVAIKREPRHPIPGPRHQLRCRHWVWSHSAYGGIVQVASSCSSEVSFAMSYRSKAST